MNTFIPYPDTEKSARCLDDLRLRKQAVETGQILQALLLNGGWKNHPAVKMYRNNTAFLINYGIEICKEIGRRGFKWQKCHKKIVFFQGAAKNGNLPVWWGDEIHSTHRSRLLMKGEFDMLCERIKRRYRIKNLNDWLKKAVGVQKFELTMEHMEDMVRITKDIPSYGLQNHYRQFDWKEEMGREYVWPV